jgi:very-short-patch-repair endonuclease
MSTTRARAFRSNLTRHEARLWGWLKSLRSDGFHFRRQAPFRGYYLDFVCFSRRLVIEVDGASHGGLAQQAHDTVRDAVLRREGFFVMRIGNRNIDESMVGVTDAILDILGAMTPRDD